MAARHAVDDLRSEILGSKEPGSASEAISISISARGCDPCRQSCTPSLRIGPINASRDHPAHGLARAVMPEAAIEAVNRRHPGLLHARGPTIENRPALLADIHLPDLLREIQGRRRPRSQQQRRRQPCSSSYTLARAKESSFRAAKLVEIGDRFACPIHGVERGDSSRVAPPTRTTSRITPRPSTKHRRDPQGNGTIE